MSAPAESAAPHPSARMEDVAKRAGVALGTVSNVLNQPHKVSPKTIDRVLQAIDELGFVPNRAARALAAGTSNTIGMVIADLSNSFFVDMARGAEREASGSGINVVLANTDMRQVKQAANLALFRQERMAGILLAPLPGADASLLDGRNSTPLVLLNDAAIEGACTVSVDNEHGGYLAANHLLSTGRRILLFAGDPGQAVPIADRYRGVQRAVAEVDGASLTLARTPEVQPRDGRDLGYEIARRPAGERPDGIVAAADLLALGLVQVLGADPSIRIPEDIAITGYDNNRAAWESLISITTVAQPGEEIGAVATRLLLDEIHDPAGHEHVHTVLQPSLVVRASTQRS